jgi:hypothetical protein
MIPRQDKQVMMMSSIQDVSAEELAKLVHHCQGTRAGDFGCAPREMRNASWEQTQPQPELSETRQRKSDADYFAKPREADWGC